MVITTKYISYPTILVTIYISCDETQCILIICGLAAGFIIVQVLRWYSTMNAFGALGFQHKLKLRLAKHIDQLSTAQLDSVTNPD